VLKQGVEYNAGSAVFVCQGSLEKCNVEVSLGTVYM